LKNEESVSLFEMTKSSNGLLLYRATRDGFTVQAFHSKCDGKGNTITIIKNNLNYVFGGYASSAWNSSGNPINDPNAFIFSLRRAGVSFKDKFTVKRAKLALY
jgi:BTB/POZ domain-containing protein KCTD9